MANESDDYTLLLLRELDYIVATQMAWNTPRRKRFFIQLGSCHTSNYFAIDIWANPC